MIYDPDDPNSSNDHIVTMEYVVDGKTYQTEINANQSDYSVGQKTEIRYDPQNPNNTVIGEMSLPLLIGICAVTVIIGAIVLFKSK